MAPRTWTLLSLLLFPTLAGCVERKDLSPPPLNPHPKEVLHVTVTFDRPEDAKRYVVTMKALYQNQQRECGYMDPMIGGGAFMYPKGSFDIPNKSRDPWQARFDIYLDRYHEASCNWELAGPSFSVRDTYTGRKAAGFWGLDEDLAPGKKYKTVCQFRADDFPQTCYGRRPIPDLPHYSRVPITVEVSKDSANLHARSPGYFSSSNFVRPVVVKDGKVSRGVGGVEQ